MNSQHTSRWSRKWTTLRSTARFVSGGIPGGLFFRLAHRLTPLRHRAFHCRLGERPFWVRPVDSIAFSEIMLDGEYDFAARLIEETREPLIVDGGANVGLFSLAMLAARPDAVVHSIEPDSGSFRILARNAAASPRSYWHTHPLALWNASGPLRFGVSSLSTGSRVDELAPAKRVETVQGITLHEFLHREAIGDIALFKLDIEGAEEAVLRESESALDRVRHLILEIHPALVDESWVMRTIERNFPFVHRVGGRGSDKPLILASRTCKEAPNG